MSEYGDTTPTPTPTHIFTPPGESSVVAIALTVSAVGVVMLAIVIWLVRQLRRHPAQCYPESQQHPEVIERSDTPFTAGASWSGSSKARVPFALNQHWNGKAWTLVGLDPDLKPSTVPIHLPSAHAAREARQSRTSELGPPPAYSPSTSLQLEAVQ